MTTLFLHSLFKSVSLERVAEVCIASMQSLFSTVQKLQTRLKVKGDNRHAGQNTRGATVIGCVPVVSFCCKGLYLYNKQS